MDILLILYLCGTLAIFAHFMAKKEPYEVAIFTATFYPLIIAFGIITLILTLGIGIMFKCAEMIRKLKGEDENAN